MFRIIMIFVLFACLAKSQSLSLKNDIKQRNISNYNEKYNTIPSPFLDIINDYWWEDSQPAISTGYYFVNSNSNIFLNENIFKDTTDSELTWLRIISGPRQFNQSYWSSSSNKEGHRYFRNPADDLKSTSEIDFYNHSYKGEIDSTDEAFAGPIPLGLDGGFRFNGIKYDSFYVSTNGLISFSNRRYNYDSFGNRTTINGSIYNKESQDYFVRDSVPRGNVDNTKDDYGYFHSALAKDPYNKYAGIRARGNKSLNGSEIGWKNTMRTAVIAPIWGDLHLSQFSISSNKKDDHGKVYYARSDSNTKLHIYIVNAQLKGRVESITCNDVNVEKDLRPGDDNYISCNVQVIIDNKNNDITIYYRSFNGFLYGQCRVDANELFRLNTTIGVRGFARHNNNIRKKRELYNLKEEFETYEDGDGYEYEQFTHYSLNEINNTKYKNTLPHLIKFKQWKNVFRVVDIQYNIRDESGDDLELKNRVKTTKVDNYELFANDERLNTIQPVAIIQNLSNDIQGSDGINYQKQFVDFKTAFQIINKASGRIIYNKTIKIDSTCLASKLSSNCTGEDGAYIRLVNLSKLNNNYEVSRYQNPEEFPNNNLFFPSDGKDSPYGKAYAGMPPYSFVEVTFPEWTASKDDINHIGNLEVKAFIIPESSNGEIIEQDWTYDDTLSRNLYVIRRLDELYDNTTEYHLIDNRAVPSVMKWVNKGAEVVDGNVVSDNPLPPHGIYFASYIDNNKDSINAWIPEKIAAAKNYRLHSPTIKMNRKTLDGLEPGTNPGGDVITSFPINIKKLSKDGMNKISSNPRIQISIQRTEKRNNWDLGWCDDVLVGPEPRVLFNNNIFTTFDHTNASSQFPDKIVVEFLNPYVKDEKDKSVHITNPDESRWRMHFRRGGAETETEVAALEVFGAGGYRRGFLEEDPDSALSNPESPNVNSLRANVFDEGIDRTYKRYWIAIPDTFKNMPFNMSENFRFRVRVLANDDALLAKHGIKNTIPDDDDNFFVDNIELRDSDLEATDIGINDINIQVINTSSPPSQIVRIPMSITLSNNTIGGAPSYYINTRITKKGYNFASYNRFDVVPVHYGMSYYVKNLQTINFRHFGTGEFEIRSKIIFPGDSDRFPDNDVFVKNIVVGDGESSFGMFNVNDEMAYDSYPQNNDIPKIIKSDGFSSGLKLKGKNNGSQNQDYFLWNMQEEETGDIGGSGSGQIAVRFELQNNDTIKGVRCYFPSIGNSTDDISIALYDDANGIPGREIRDTRFYRKKGVSDVLFDDNENPLIIFDDYVEYKLDKEYIFDFYNRKFWVVVTQLGQTPLNLGASKFRGGTRITNVYDKENEPHGLGNIQLSLFDGFKRLNTLGTQKLNDNHFAMENRTGSNEWIQFLPNVGNPAFPHNNFVGLSPVDKQTFTLSRGIWIPMIRLVLGYKLVGLLPNEDWPVELAEFDGIIRNNKAELYWETESEIDNKGFYLERKLDSQREDSWERLTWINGQGAGNHTVGKRYEYTDENILANVKYNYRLHQEDIDGTIDNTSSGIVTLINESNIEFVVELTSTNPFDDFVTFSATLPESGELEIIVYDLFGREVETIENQIYSAGKYYFEWNPWKNENITSNSMYNIQLKLNGRSKNLKVLYSK